MDSLLGAFVLAVFAYSAPLVLASLGGLCSERAGVVNIALEGKMLAAACLAAIAGLSTGSILAAVGAGMAAAVLLSLLHWWLTQHFNVDHVISGMGINGLALGGTAYLAEVSPALKEGLGFPRAPEWVFWSISLLAAVGLWLFLARARGGLRLNAVGQDPDKARTVGLDPVRIRLKALVVTGLLCGLAGALIAASAGSFAKDMTAGRGYIALAALILGGWKPLPALAACLAFSVAFGLQIVAQNTAIGGVDLPTEFWQALPYILTLASLALLVQNGKAPAGLGKD